MTQLNFSDHLLQLLFLSFRELFFGGSFLKILNIDTREHFADERGCNSANRCHRFYVRCYSILLSPVELIFSPPSQLKFRIMYEQAKKSLVTL